MDTNTITLIAVVVVLFFTGAILIPIFIRRNRVSRLQSKFGPEYEQTVQALGNEEQAQAELEARQKHVKTFETRSLTALEREHYQMAWAAVQSNFVDEPGQSLVEADRLIMEVMQLRAYPVSDFEQRAADLSVTYPELVSSYRAARVTTLKNEQSEADTEETRQAILHYRSLFTALVENEAVAA